LGRNLYEFGDFRLDPAEQRLLRGSTPIPLSPKAFELLVALISRHGHLVSRETLMQAIWPDSFVEETNLTVNISLLRKTLGNMPDGQPWIATVPKRGYRFDGPVLSAHGETGAWQVLKKPGTGEPPSLTARAAESVVEPVPDTPVEPPLNLVDAPASNPRSKSRPAGTRWLLALAALIIMVLGVWGAIHLYRSRGEGAASVHTIAVLPFAFSGGGNEDQYLGVGLTDAVIARLSRLSQIVVRPIEAVRSLGPSPDPVDAGRRLNVQAVLDGTVQRVGGRTQVAVKLRRVSDGATLWQEHFDEQNSSDFQIEDTISQRLASALTLRLTPDQQRQLATPATPNSEAYELCIQGRYEWNKRSVDSVRRSIELFQQATKIDPKYAAAWSGLADSWILAGSYGNSFLTPAEAMPMAKDAAQRALAADPQSAEAHTSLAYIRLMWDWDFAGAEQEFKRALEINPGYVNAHHWYSHELVALGRLNESHEESETALNLDPADVVINEHMAWHHMMAREYDRSIPQARKAVELDPSFVQAHRVLGLDLLYTGQGREACAEFEKGVDLSHGDPVANAYLARCYAITHREPEARKLLADLEQARSERYVSGAEIAAVYAALNDQDSAIKWIASACDEHAGALIYLNTDRIWDPLRKNPKFAALVQRVNLSASAIDGSAANR